MSDSFKDVKDQFYKMSIYDLENGMTVDELRDLLKDYEKREFYEACEGINKAINDARFWIVLNHTSQTDLKDKITIDFETDD